MDVWRPEPPVDEESMWARVVAWVKFVGPVKVAATGVGIVIAGVIGWSLVRPAEPGAEATLGTLAPSTSVDISAASTPPAPGASILVHVAGSVRTPGVYELVLGDRVVDAVAAAGGALGRAATDAVNLAAVVSDGERIYLPAIGEIVPSSTSSSAGGAPAGAESPLDINTATAEQLDALPGVGPSTAAAIVARRDEIGRFVGYDDLLSVPGIGPAKVDALRGLIAF